MSLSLTLSNAQVWGPAGMQKGDLSFADGVITTAGTGRPVDLSGCRVLPGIVDIHGDGFERHLAPRRGAMKDLGAGLAATEAELAANGITTAILAQFWSWEGGMRGPEFAKRFLQAVDSYQGLGTDLRVQLRFETHMLEDYAEVERIVAHHGVSYVVFNDHLPHVALSKGKRPPRLTGQALKGGRNPEAHLAMMLALHAQSSEVPAAVQAMAGRLAAQGVILGSHDDASIQTRTNWRAMGVRVSEFPETQEAAEAAAMAGDPVVLGAPNVVRGGSHSGNVSAADLLAQGIGDALASDYHYPAPRLAALALGRWDLVSAGPARVLGLTDRGSLCPGKRADIVVLDPDGRVGATIAGGRMTYLAGDIATRFLG